MVRLGFIGAGNMAEAIARGVVRAGVYERSEIVATDPVEVRRMVFAEELGIECGADFKKAAGAEVVVLAVKPFVMEEALKQIRGTRRGDALVISIAAGISTGFIEGVLGGKDGGQDARGTGSGAAGEADRVGAAQGGVRVVRVMPNTPMLVGKGMSAVCGGKWAREEDLVAAERIFGAGGKVVRVGEELMDAVTAVSGSGPAYVFYLAECLAAAGVRAGLSEEQAGELARQTVVGAAALLEGSKDTAAELRRKVTTPKGTTQAAIETMAAGGFAGMMERAVGAAKRRAGELGR